MSAIDIIRGKRGHEPAPPQANRTARTEVQKPLAPLESLLAISGIRDICLAFLSPRARSGFYHPASAPLFRLRGVSPSMQGSVDQHLRETVTRAIYPLRVWIDAIVTKNGTDVPLAATRTTQHLDHALAQPLVRLFKRPDQREPTVLEEAEAHILGDWGLINGPVLDSEMLAAWFYRHHTLTSKEVAEFVLRFTDAIVISQPQAVMGSTRWRKWQPVVYSAVNNDWVSSDLLSKFHPDTILAVMGETAAPPRIWNIALSAWQCLIERAIERERLHDAPHSAMTMAPDVPPLKELFSKFSILCQRAALEDASTPGLERLLYEHKRLASNGLTGRLIDVDALVTCRCWTALQCIVRILGPGYLHEHLPDNGRQAVLAAARRSNLALLQLLHGEGSSPSVVSAHARTIARSAAARAHGLPILQWLYATPSLQSSITENGAEIVQTAAQYNAVDILQWFDDTPLLKHFITDQL